MAHSTVTKARPAGGHVLYVRFAGERKDRKLDLTGLIARSAHFAPLADDAESFAKAAIVEDGLGLAWPVEAKWAGWTSRPRRSSGSRRSRI